MFQIAADMVNRSLDAFGEPPIGDIYDGSRISEAARRQYGPVLRQILRAAHWNFARKIAPLQLLADATGNTLDAATGLPISKAVEPPWCFAYAWPIDGIAARWLPQQLVGSPPTPPIMTNMQTSWPGQRSVPARFLVATSEDFPLMSGEIDWDSLPDFSGTEGVGLTARRIVLTNVTNAHLVYTKLVAEIEQWDPMFAEAFINALGTKLAPVAISDPKAVLSYRAQQISIAQGAIALARLKNANEAGFPQSIDHVADWIRARSPGYGLGWGGAEGPGVLRYGWEASGWADGSVF
jgi:hypothetical protein